MDLQTNSSTEGWQGSLSISVWLIVVSVATRPALGPSSSLSYFLCSSANGYVTVHSLLLLAAKPVNLSLSNFNLESSSGITSAKQRVLRFSSHMASGPEVKQKSGSKGSSPLCVVLPPLLMCHLQAHQTELGTNSVRCFSDTESHIRPISPLLYAA